MDHHRSRVKSRPAIRPQLGWVAAAACLVVAVILGAMLVSTRRELAEQRQHQTQLTAVLFAPDVQAVTKRVKTGTATVVFSLKRHELIVTSAGLPPLRAGKIYQLWLINKPIRSAGLLPAEENGHTRPFLVTGVRSTDIFGLTVEPAGGTKQPTTTPILEIKLKHAPRSTKT